MVSSLGPAGEPVEPENWGPLLPAAPLGVEAQKRSTAYRLRANGRLAGRCFSAVRPDPSPCMGAPTSAPGQRATETANDWRGKFYRETDWSIHGNRYAGRYSGFRPGKRHLWSATQTLACIGNSLIPRRWDVGTAEESVSLDDG